MLLAINNRTKIKQNIQPRQYIYRNNKNSIMHPYKTQYCRSLNLKFDEFGVGGWKKIVVDMCGVAGKWQTSDLKVTDSRPALATRHIRCVLVVNSPNKFNLISWLLIYL